jgi:hypothetical protein
MDRLTELCSRLYVLLPLMHLSSYNVLWLFLLLSIVNSIASSLLICACLQAMREEGGGRVACQSSTTQTSSQVAPQGGAPTTSINFNVAAWLTLRYVREIAN